MPTVRSYRPRAAALIFALMLVLLPATAALANSGGSQRDPSDSRSRAMPASYTRGLQQVEDGDLKAARRSFESANRKRARSPEILNMLAYTQRKTGALDAAIVNYKEALQLKPDFPQAREYLGEAYLQAALRELKMLKRAGPDASEEHAQLLRALQQATSGEPAATQARKGW